MKILFQSRLDIFDQRGGDTVQMLETKKALEKLGVTVDISTELTPNLDKYDLVHVFNLDWVCEPYMEILNAKKQNKPVVLSPIHHSLQEFERYEKESRYGLAVLGNFLLPYQPLRDMARNIAKAVFYPKKLRPAFAQLFRGIRYQQKRSIELSDYVLVQTNEEAADLEKAYKATGFKWKKVVNGVNKEKFLHPNIFEATKLVQFTKYIVCVGRIEPRKNQIALIHAFNELKNKNEKFKDFGLVFVGSINKHHPTYAYSFNNLINNNKDILHTGFLEQEVLAGILFNAEIFACPSWFETTGLVYLEAIVAGIRSIVASGNRSKEYLEENAIYCDPGSSTSIKKALVKSLGPTVLAGFVDSVLSLYTWENCAKQTLQVYKSVLGKNAI